MANTERPIWAVIVVSTFNVIYTAPVERVTDLSAWALFVPFTATGLHTLKIDATRERWAVCVVIALRSDLAAPLLTELSIGARSTRAAFSLSLAGSIDTCLPRRTWTGGITLWFGFAAPTDTHLTNRAKPISTALGQRNTFPVDTFIVRWAIGRVITVDQARAFVANADFALGASTIDSALHLLATAINAPQRRFAVQIRLTGSGLACSVQTNQSGSALVIVQTSIHALTLKAPSSRRTVTINSTLRDIDAATFYAGLSHPTISIYSTLRNDNATFINAC